MSRGPGRIQTFILDGVAKDGVVPLPYLAWHYANGQDVEVTPHLRSAFRRAATVLGEDGAVSQWYLWLPTRQYANGEFGAYREVACVGPPSLYELTGEHLASAETGMRLYVSLA